MQNEDVPLVEFTYLVFTRMPNIVLVLSCKMLEDVLLVEFLYLVFTRMPVRVSVGDSGLSCCTRVTHFEH